MTKYLSVILITKNESVNIAPCLDSVKNLADEIIILDSGSTDNTLEIARQYTDKIYTNTNWQGFGRQRRLAQNYATCDWVLMLDADERITPKLAEEIKSSICQTEVAGFYIKRKNFFLGKELKYGGGTDKVLRLYREQNGRSNFAEVHEKILVTGKTRTLKNHLLHLSTDNLNTALVKMNQYSSLGAEKLNKKRKTSGVIRAIAHGLWTFFRIYIIQLGFLDGKRGFILAVLKAEGSYYKYLKLCFSFRQQS